MNIYIYKYIYIYLYENKKLYNFLKLFIFFFILVQVLFYFYLVKLKYTISHLFFIHLCLSVIVSSLLDFHSLILKSWLSITLFKTRSITKSIVIPCWAFKDEKLCINRPPKRLQQFTSSIRLCN